MKVGYARVSSTDQNLARQIKALKTTGCEKIFEEKQSGKSTENRPELQAAITYVRQGDTLVIASLDRLSRNYDDASDIIKQIRDKQVRMEVLDAPFLSMQTGDSDMDKFMFDMLTKLLAYMAQTERKKIRERQRQGIEIAKSNGKYRGTRPAYAEDSPNPQKRFIYHRIVDQLRNKATGARISYRAIAAETGVSVQTVINIKNRLNEEIPE
ncbi:recombinase family protein (plasmid) [Levilactobacillus brevis]|uniref:Recombinase family protein n=1 Tax=Levilactobacillus brevis TaxID=1580 RepID=A0AB38X9C8_LEVBR|nr:recombinase family protein [Levilactobacillus brevis]WAD02977.1 recombinase family protein [Levilactobacillus brevis]